MSKRRHISPGTVYHFISRFVARQWFAEEDKERFTYLSLLGDLIVRTDWRCLAYAVMSSHVHLVLRAGEAKMVAWARDVHSDFAIWTNGRRDRIGSVFVHEPKTIAVHPDGVGAVIAYVHQNPVRAGVVRKAADSTWTSHQQYIGRARQLPWLDVSQGLELAGFPNGEAFDRWVTHEEIKQQRVEAFAMRPRRGRPPTMREAFSEELNRSGL